MNTIEGHPTKSTLADIPAELIIITLQYLRAVDLANVAESNKFLFSKEKVSKAILHQLKSTYNVPTSNDITYSPGMLYANEVKSILSALNAPQPLINGYWISTLWLANAKKFYEAINLSQIETNCQGKKFSTPNKHKQKIRTRRGSDALPPWPSMTTDILCCHGKLSLSKGSGAKRRMIDKCSWNLLRKFYPFGSAFSVKCHDCDICTKEFQEFKSMQAEKKEDLIEKRRYLLNLNVQLEHILTRKNGFPIHLLVNAYSSKEESTEFNYNIGDKNNIINNDEVFVNRQPLLPGLYNIIPRYWLKVWRNICKDISCEQLPDLDYATLLCRHHGHLIVPSHLEVFLLGIKKTLFSGLGTSTGEVVEILSAEEWDSLQMSVNFSVDFHIRFSLDGENVIWNTPTCTMCRE